jgi:hypothetical protein
MTELKIVLIISAVSHKKIGYSMTHQSIDAIKFSPSQGTLFPKKNKWDTRPICFYPPACCRVPPGINRYRKTRPTVCAC